MTAAAEPRVLQEFLECGQLGILDKASKAALRLCSKKIRDHVDATITACKVEPCDLDALLNCNWPLSKIKLISQRGDNAPEMPPASITAVLFDLILKFPLLETLLIDHFEELEEFPENIGDLSQLKQLSINGSVQLKALPPSFGQLTALERLDLNYCSRMTLDGLGPLQQVNRLKHLQIYGHITYGPLLPKWLSSYGFPLLEQLSLGPLVSSFPPYLTNFNNLTKLSLIFEAGASEIDVPESISALSSLRNLTLHSQGCVSFPDSFSKLTTLDDLLIGALTDKEDIAPLQYLTGLIRLDLSSFHIEDESSGYPDFLWNLTLLKNLNLGRCDVRSLPDALGNLKNLEVLKLKRLSYIHKLPESIGTLSSLTRLDVFYCHQLKSLPDSVGNLAALKILSIFTCKGLERLPESIGNLRNMELLKIWGCDEFSQLPSSLGSLSSLEHLCVGGCQKLHELPDSIGNLNALKVLKIFDCFKLYIPDSFADLVLGKAYEDWSLQQIWFTGCRRVVLSQKAEQALALLKQHGVYKSRV